MKLFDLITYLRNPNNLGQLYETFNQPTESEAILIYMKDSLDIDSELKFFEIEKTDDKLIFIEGGIIYYQFFPVDYVVEILDSHLSDNENALDNFDLAKRLLDYRINDA